MAFSPTHAQRKLGQWNAWIACPRPRPVRLKRGYRFWVTFLAATLVTVPVLVVGFLIAEHRAHPPMTVMNADLWRSVPFIVLPPILLLLMFWMFSGHRLLVTNGEVAIGRVTDVCSRRRGQIITYEFLDCSGRLITTTSPDNTRSFSPGMDIAVFFNSENPRTDQIALCGSVYEVADAA
jgi:hypothetical protein